MDPSQTIEGMPRMKNCLLKPTHRQICTSMNLLVHALWFVFLFSSSACAQQFEEMCAGDNDGFQAGDQVDVPFQRHPFDNAILWEHNNHNGSHGPDGRMMDQLTQDHTFGHSLVDLPIGQIDLGKPVLLKIEFRCAGGAIDSTDGIGLQLRDEDMPSSYPGPLWNPPMSWGQSLPDYVDIYGNGEPCNTGVLTTVDLRDLVATQGSLAGRTIAETINNLGYLDIFVGDDTGIDFVCLCYSTSSCELDTKQILCELDATGVPTDNYILTGLFTNLQDIPGTHLLLPQNAISPSNVDLCFGSAGSNVIVLDSPLNNGDSFELGRIDGVPSNENAIIIKNAQPGDEVCFRMTLLGDNGVECCTVEACVVMPPCDCLQIDTRYDEIVIVDCDPSTGLVDFDYTFQLTNLFGQDVYHSFLSPNGSETISPDYFFVGPLPSGQSTMITTRITGATSAQLVDFLVTVHNEDLSECCSREHQVLAPECSANVNAVPNGFSAFRGNQVQGNLESVFTSDDDRLCFTPGFTLSSLEAPVWIVFDGTIGTTPGSLNFDVESSATTPGLTTTVDIWNWSSNEYAQLDSYSMSFNNDVTYTMAIAGDVNDFVDGTGAVRSRVGTRQTGFVINYPWEVRFDCVSWTN